MIAKVRTPASSANLGPGFDALGLALGLYDTLTLIPAETGAVLKVSGEGAGKLDKDPERSLALRAANALYERVGAEMPAVEIRMENEIPLSRGLGSSAAAIVGSLTAANIFSGAGLSKEDLFLLAVEVEGHADNVAAALYGGLTVSYRQGETFSVKRCVPAPNVGSAVLVPEAGLSTAKARAVLPTEITRENAVFNLGRTALLIEALLTGDLGCLEAAVEDALHQPWRRALIPDYNVTEYAAYRAGAKGVALSGAGPTLIAFYDKSDEDRFKIGLNRELKESGIRRRALFLDIDLEGAAVIGG